MTVIYESVDRYTRSVLEKVVRGNLEVDLLVKPVKRKAVVVWHVDIGSPQTRQHIALVRQLQVKALRSYLWSVSCTAWVVGT